MNYNEKNMIENKYTCQRLKHKIEKRNQKTIWNLSNKNKNLKVKTSVTNLPQISFRLDNNIDKTNHRQFSSSR